MDPPKINWDEVASIIDKYKDQQWGLIPLLQEIQEYLGYIPPETIEPIATALNIFPSQIQGVITFYAGFSLTPKGKYVLRICCGTACHVKGGKSVLKLVKQDLGLNEGETSSDYQFTIESAACLGACALAPTMMVNRDYYGKLSPPKVSSIISYYGKEKEKG